MDDNGKVQGEGSEGEVQEPQVTSSDPEERKLARRLRIQRRVETIKKQHQSDGELTVPEVEKTLLEIQIESSAEILEQLLVEGEEVVTNVRIGNDTREVNRREKESLRRTEILDKLQNEATEAEEMYNKINRKWNEISQYKDPLDIHDSISIQKEKCDELIKQKDEIIAMLREEINSAELKYTADQETQDDDITTLVRRIDNQVDLMRRSYRNELKLIEETIQTERKIMIEANTKKWDMLHKQRNEDEELNMQKKISLADEFLDAFYTTRVEHEERYRETKIALEKESEILQTELEKLKAACLLNGEKLDYNYHILKKREDENIIIRSQQKRLINKLQDEINRIKKKINDYRSQSNDKISKITADINKMRKCVFEVENKADCIAQVNDNKYHEVWKLNEDTTHELLDKILSTDKIIHEQILGQEWKNPKKHLYKKTNLSSYKEAMEILGAKRATVKKCDIRSRNLNMKGSKEEEFPTNIIQAIIDKISLRSAFLVESRLKEIIPELSSPEQKLVQIDNVFNALGVTSNEVCKCLMKFFLPYVRCLVCEQTTEKPQPDRTKSAQIKSAISIVTSHAKSETEDFGVDVMKAVSESPGIVADIVLRELEEVQDEVNEEQRSASESIASFDDDESQNTGSTASHTVHSKAVTRPPSLVVCRLNHPVHVEPACVFKALKQFVTAFHYVDDEAPTMAKRLLQKRNTISRLIIPEDVKMFWSQFEKIFTQNHEELWNGLLFGLKKYYAILQDRHDIYLEVKVLRRDNTELKHLLKNCPYLSKKKKPKKKYSYYSSASSASRSSGRASRDI